MKIFNIIFTYILFSQPAISCILNKQFVMFENADRTNEITVKNDTNTLKHYKFSLVDMHQQTNLDKLEITNKPDNAKQFLIFSPKETFLKPGEQQTIRFKRKPLVNDTPHEYISHLLVEEHNITNNQFTELNNKINPLNHYIPVMIRRGKLTSNIDFEQIVLNNNNLKIKLKNNSNKSCLYNIKITDNDKLLSTKENIHIFPQTKEISLNLRLFSKPKEKCIIQLTEINNPYNKKTKILDLT